VNKQNKEILKEFGQGLTSQETYTQRFTNYGPNSTDVPQKGNLKIIFDEVLSPFYLFQVIP